MTERPLRINRRGGMGVFSNGGMEDEDYIHALDEYADVLEAENQRLKDIIMAGSKGMGFDEVEMALSEAEKDVDRLDAELQAVMHSVDKWFDEIPNDNPATRAASAREIALKVIDNLDAELREAARLLREWRTLWSKEWDHEGGSCVPEGVIDTDAFLARHKEAGNG